MGSSAAVSVVEAYLGCNSEAELFSKYASHTPALTPRTTTGLAPGLGVLRSRQDARRPPHKLVTIFSPHLTLTARKEEEVATTMPRTPAPTAAACSGRTVLATLLEGRVPLSNFRPRRSSSTVASSADVSAEQEVDVRARELSRSGQIDHDVSLNRGVRCRGASEDSRPRMETPGTENAASSRESCYSFYTAPSRLAESTACSETLSHATTPSWRSRSSYTPLHGRARGGSCGGSASFAVPFPHESSVPHATIRTKRLPVLPDEARGLGCSTPSEVRLLSDIDSVVGEANAMLVESFLNVKRQYYDDPDRNAGPLESGSGSHVGGSDPSNRGSLNARSRAASHLTAAGRMGSSVRRQQRPDIRSGRLRPVLEDADCLVMS